MTAPTKIAAARAADRLTKALAELAARGLRHHCADPELSHLWLSDHEDERALAAKLCFGCPVQMERWSVARARRERFGVWGAVDFTPPKPGRPKKIESVA
jgi:Transcription factor WhiB